MYNPAMAEKLRLVDAGNLSPEHWGNHSPADNCKWIEKPAHLIEPFYDDRLRAFAEETIVNYLCENQGDPKPISTLKQGNTFDGTRLPEGTIIKYNREELKIHTNRSGWGNPYLNFDLWGAVCDRTNDDGGIEKVILPFIFFPSWGDFLKSSTEDPKLTVGKTRHRRIEGHNGHLSESLIKITSLEVHKIP